VIYLIAANQHAFRVVYTLVMNQQGRGDKVDPTVLGLALPRT